MRTSPSLRATSAESGRRPTRIARWMSSSMRFTARSISSSSTETPVWRARKHGKSGAMTVRPSQRGRSDAQTARRLAAARAEQRAHFVQLREDRLRALEKEAPLVRQRNVPCRAAQQLHAELLLERRQVAAHRSQRHRNRTGGGRQTAGFHHSDKHVHRVESVHQSPFLKSQESLPLYDATPGFRNSLHSPLSKPQKPARHASSARALRTLPAKDGRK